MSQFTELKLEQAIIQLLSDQGYPHHLGDSLDRSPTEVLLKDDLRAYLTRRYAADGITLSEIKSILRKLEAYSAADLYDSNKAIHKLVADGFLLKREDRSKKDLYIQLIDYSGLPLQQLPKPGEVGTLEIGRVAKKPAAYNTGNCYRLVNQLKIEGNETRIPDAILYINGLPLVVFEFKSAIREQATLFQAYEQLTVRYERDIPELMNTTPSALSPTASTTSSGPSSPPMSFYYPWRRVTGEAAIAQDSINALHTLNPRNV